MASVTLLLWSPSKNSSSTSFKLKGNKAFPQAERLFLSDNSLSQSKCEQDKEVYMPLVNLSGPNPLQVMDWNVPRLHLGYRWTITSGWRKTGEAWKAGTEASPITDGVSDGAGRFQSKWHILESYHRQPESWLLPKKKKFSFELSDKLQLVSLHGRAALYTGAYVS